MTSLLKPGASVSLSKEALGALLDGLRRMGYQPVGPRVREAAIVYDVLESPDDLPRGYTSEQNAGYYRLIPGDGTNYFDITPGPQSWKQFLFPPVSEILRAQREGKNWQLLPVSQEAPALAFVGVRPCELAAIQVQDRVFLRADWQDPVYRARRERVFLLAVNCLHPGDTCFCASMGTGPQAGNGFDLCLTELEDVFLVEMGSERGCELMASLPYQAVREEQRLRAQQGLEAARQAMGRHVADVEGLPDLLLKHLDARRWQEVAQRCLSCANCTQVCPTCFCWDTREVMALNGKVTHRERVWDSCFNPDYSYVAGGNSRPSTLARYRQWLIHKFATWKYQFGTSGCVGCGRCITWCPARIDITEELAAIRQESEA